MDKGDQSRGTALRLALVRLRSTYESIRASVNAAPLLVVAAAGAALGDAVGRSGCKIDGLIFAAASSFAVVVLRRCGFAASRAVVAAVALVVANGSAFLVRHPEFPDDHVSRLPMRTALTVEGTVLDDVPVSPVRARLRLDADRVLRDGAWQKVQGRIQISVESTTRAWLAGERVRTPLRLRRPRNFGNPNEFDYEGYLAVRDVYVTAFVTNDSGFVALGHGPPAWSDWLGRWRRNVGALIAATLSPPQSTVLAALIIGTDVPLPRELRTAFSRAGVSHVLSISGLHVGLVAAAAHVGLLWLLARSQWLLLCANVPKLAVAASVLPVLLYAGIAGDNVATRRAVIMIIVFLGAVLVDRQRHMLVSLAVAALMILLAEPGSSLDISFQLSFVAVLGLALGIERFWPWWRRQEELYLVRLRQDWRTRLSRTLALYVAVSASALAATTPLTAFHFNQISLVAPIANAVVVPLLGSVAVVLGLGAALILPLSEPVAAVAIKLAGPVVQLGIALTRICAAVPAAALRIVTPSLLELALIYLALLALVLWRGAARVRAVVAVAIVLSIDGAYWYADRYLRSDLRVTFVSVGEGDSSIVEFPGGAVMVIDAGGSRGDDFDIGERVVAPFLWSRKIARCDYLVMSHPDRDHYGGLAFLAANFAPRELWTTGAAVPGESFAALLRAIDESAARIIVLRAGDRRRIAGAEIRVLSPPALDKASDNDESLVLSLDFAGRRLLFPGDIQQLAEERLVQEDGSRLRSAVLKVPHHGSRTSSTLPFVAAVRPTVAVISTGFDNRFHFPSPDILRRYAENGAELWRTDLGGAVQVRIDACGALAATNRMRGNEALHDN